MKIFKPKFPQPKSHQTAERNNKIYQKFLSGKTRQEIAKEMNVPDYTVKFVINQAQKILRGKTG
jgi:DNA-binding NarL/FixJ family response regulator